MEDCPPLLLHVTTKFLGLNEAPSMNLDIFGYKKVKHMNQGCFCDSFPQILSKIALRNGRCEGLPSALARCYHNVYSLEPSVSMHCLLLL